MREQGVAEALGGLEAELVGASWAPRGNLTLPDCLKLAPPPGPALLVAEALRHLARRLSSLFFGLKAMYARQRRPRMPSKRLTVWKS